MTTRKAVAVGQTGSYKLENGAPTALIRLSNGTLVLPFIKGTTDTKWTYHVSTDNGGTWSEVTPTAPGVVGQVQVPLTGRRVTHRLGPGDKIVSYDQDGWLGKATLTTGANPAVAFGQARVLANTSLSNSWSRLKAQVVTLSGPKVDGVVIQETVLSVGGGNQSLTAAVRVEFGKKARASTSGPVWRTGNVSLNYDAWDMVARALAEGRHTGDGLTASTTATREHLVYTDAASNANLKIGMPKATSSSPTQDDTATTTLARSVDVFDALFTGTHVFAFHDASSNTVGAVSRDEARTQTRTYEDSPALPAGTLTILRAAYLHTIDTFAVLAGDGTVSGGMLNLWLSYFHAGTDTWQPWARVDSDSDWENKSLQAGVAWDPYPSDARARWALSRVSGTQRDVYLYTAKIGNPPGPPTWETPAQFTVHSPTAALALDWTFVDPDDQATQSAYRLRRTVDGGPWQYWNGTAWENTEGASNKTVSTATTLTLASGWAATDDLVHEFQVQTWDEDDNGPSAWSDALRVRVGAAPVNPTVSAPTVGQQINQAFTVRWTVTEQLRWQIRLVGNSAGKPDTNTVHYDSGVRSDSTARNATVPAQPTGTYHVGLRTWSLRDVASSWVWVRISLQADAPRAPRATVTAGDGRLVVAVVNQALSPGDDALSAPARNEIRLRPVGDTGDGICVATGQPDATVDIWTVASGVAYEVAAETVALNGLRRRSTWAT